MLDSSQLETFRARFEAKEPDPKNFVRRVTKFAVYLTVEDLVESRRQQGFAWEGIAADFNALGVTMLVSTLKTCYRRARARRRSATGTARPSRSSAPLPTRRRRPHAPQGDRELVAVAHPDDAMPTPSETPSVEREMPAPEPSHVPMTTVPGETTNEQVDLGSREEESASAAGNLTPADATASSAIAGDVPRRRDTATEATTPPLRHPEAAAAPESLVTAAARMGLDAVRSRASPREARRLAFIPKPDGDL